MDSLQFKEIFYLSLTGVVATTTKPKRFFIFIIMDNKHLLLFANIPTILFLLFSGYCLYIDEFGFAVCSFIVSALCATTYKTKDE